MRAALRSRERIDLFDYDNLESSKVNTAIVMMSRGCFFNCTYCGNSQFRNVYPNKKIYARFRSPQNGILYLKTLLEKHPNIKFINFRDAIFNMFPKWFDEFIELYKQEIHLPFTGNIRFDILTEDTVRRMKEAGCYTIDMGLESGDPEMRFKYLKRNMTDEMIDPRATHTRPFFGILRVQAVLFSRIFYHSLYNACAYGKYNNSISRLSDWFLNRRSSAYRNGRNTTCLAVAILLRIFSFLCSFLQRHSSLGICRIMLLI